MLTMQELNRTSNLLAISPPFIVLAIGSLDRAAAIDLLLLLLIIVMVMAAVSVRAVSVRAVSVRVMVMIKIAKSAATSE